MDDLIAVGKGDACDAFQIGALLTTQALDHFDDGLLAFAVDYHVHQAGA